MQALFGFSNFQSTKVVFIKSPHSNFFFFKDKPHEETNIEGVRKNKKMKRKFR